MYLGIWIGILKFSNSCHRRSGTTAQSIKKVKEFPKKFCITQIFKRSQFYLARYPAQLLKPGK